jgi:hypothetical protein
MKKFAEEAKKIDWDKNDIEIRGVQPWGSYRRLNEEDEEWIGNDGGFVVMWSKPHCGFGELTFYLKDGKLHCDTECMSRKFVSQVLEKVAETVEIHDGRDAED